MYCWKVGIGGSWKGRLRDFYTWGGGGGGGIDFFSKEGFTLSYVLVTRGARGFKGSSLLILKLTGWGMGTGLYWVWKTVGLFLSSCCLGKVALLMMTGFC